MSNSDLLGDVPEAKASRHLGRSIAGGGDQKNRKRQDFYPTPPEVTRAFIRAEGERLGDFPVVWEPCGRGGAMLRELNAGGRLTIGTDLVSDPDNNVSELDLLTAQEALSPCVVTNPPYNIAKPIILHLLETLQVEYLALLLKGTFWHAENRAALFRKHQPARWYALTWRPDFIGLGAPTMEFGWTVWDRAHQGPCEYRLLSREAGQARLI